MGEVYRAEDTVLGREVAIKVLPKEFTASAERVARFEREARVLAAVDHPKIASIFSFETASVASVEVGAKPIHFLVMQLAEGETLSERIARGPIRFDTAIDIALQIAEGIEAAHEKGIVHRDLKPGNIKVDSDGNVTVLDFGLAKAFDPADSATGSDEDDHPSLLSESPTVTAEMTRDGVVLGTAGYMSPEQALGKVADRRSDIWAFGCVLYEMLSARRAFGGATITDSLARILEREPDWTVLPGDTPVGLSKLIRRCLVKDPKRRFHDMADVRIELEEMPEDETAPVLPERESGASWLRVLPWVAAALGIGVGIWGLVIRNEVDQPRPVVRFSLPASPLAVRGNPATSQVAISPDGSTLAYVVGEGHVGQLYVRRLDSPKAVALVGAEMVTAPFFSPDGSWVGFTTDGAIQRISIEGGKVWTICDAGVPVGATWSRDGTIIYGEEVTFGLWRVPWNGGEPTRLTNVNREGGEYLHCNPQILPGGDAVLFSAMDAAGGRSMVALLDLQTGERKDLFSQEGNVTRYLASGHIAYGQGGSLMAVAFDAGRREVVGQPVAVFDGLLMGYSLTMNLAHFAVSDNGTLAFVSGPSVRAKSRLVWVDRAGTIEPFGQEEDRFFGPRFSPDGTRLVVAGEIDGNPMQIWLRDLVRGTFRKIQLEGMGYWPQWSPDGRRIIFTYFEEAIRWDLASIEPEGSRPIEFITDDDFYEQALAWAPDGRTLIFQRNDLPDTAWDVLEFEPAEDDEPRNLLASPSYEMLADLSPDGRWLAYASGESGRFEVYVRSYPNLESKWQISTGGGTEPVWSSDGRELFFREEDGRTMWAVPIAAEPEFVAGRPDLLFEGDFAPTPWFGRNFDVSPDGRSFVMVEQVLPEGIHPELVVAVNWFTELEKMTTDESD